MKNKPTRHANVNTTRRSFLRDTLQYGVKYGVKHGVKYGVIGLVGATALVGCGQKGPLFLPDGDSTSRKKKKSQS